MVWGVTDYVGALREVVLFILGLSTKRFGVLFIPFFHGSVFRKQRFLKGLPSLCVQQLYVRFLHWITSWEGVCHW